MIDAYYINTERDLRFERPIPVSHKINGETTRAALYEGWKFQWYRISRKIPLESIVDNLKSERFENALARNYF